MVRVDREKDHGKEKWVGKCRSVILFRVAGHIGCEDEMEALALTSQPRAAQSDRRDSLGDLAHAAVAGDLAATRQVLEAVAPRVVAVVRRVLGGSHPDVDDIAQESFIAIVKALPAFRGDCSLRGYAARIAVRTAVTARKRTARKLEQLRELHQEESLGSRAPSAGDRAHARNRLELLRTLLAELPAGQGETLALRVVLGCSIQEIAQTTDVPVNTVRSRLRLAKQAMRTRIEEDPDIAEALEIA
jgi:RNA polymerase sigma-70 factor (ECF subfamily)